MACECRVEHMGDGVLCSLQLREAAVAAMIRAQQEKAKPQAQPPILEERVSGKPSGMLLLFTTCS